MSDQVTNGPLVAVSEELLHQRNAYMAERRDRLRKAGLDLWAQSQLWAQNGHGVANRKSSKYQVSEAPRAREQYIADQRARLWQYAHAMNVLPSADSPEPSTCVYNARIDCVLEACVSTRVYDVDPGEDAFIDLPRSSFDRAGLTPIAGHPFRLRVATLRNGREQYKVLPPLRRKPKKLAPIEEARRKRLIKKLHKGVRG